MDSFSHYSVLLPETIALLDIKPDGTYIDCTLGGGGHSLRIAERLRNGRLIAIDRDADAIAASRKRLSAFSERVIFVNDNFKQIKEILRSLGLEKADGIIADLGVSSHQLDTPERGFSYHYDAPLDMRMDSSSGFSAYDVVNGYSAERLAKILFTYGEERFAGRIAARIAAARQEKDIRTTAELVDIIKSALPPKRLHENKHPARQTFQAIRIEVNDEIGILSQAVADMIDCLAQGGVAALITFHSLEDRAVKEAFKKETDGCVCPKDFPVCVCGFQKRIEILTKKPVLPGEAELKENNRSRSAKLRAARKL